MRHQIRTTGCAAAAPQGRPKGAGKFAPHVGFFEELIAGLTHDALIAPWVIKTAMDGPDFAAYVREGLIPGITPDSAVFLDHLATHRNKEAVAALETYGCWFLYLVPNSLDMPPMQQAFSRPKTPLRHPGA